MRRVIIFTGGSIDIEFLRTQSFSKEDEIICADHGLEAAYKLGITPDLLVGDFDSADSDILSLYEEKENINIVRFRPEKDDTDTELALHMAMKRNPDEILVFGASGTRLDHTLANIGLLSQTLKQGIRTYLWDLHNRISMIGDTCCLRKEQAFGDYVTLLPFGGDAEGVTLQGFKYPLENAVMHSGSSLGVSNELVEEEAVIYIRKGKLLVIESKD